MTTLTRPLPGLPTVAPGTRLLGEIITWSATGVKVRHRDLVEALRGSDLDESVARELAPRHAFTRACKKLSEARIIRQVSENDKSLTFQLTAERKEDDRFTYALETLLTLDKATGRVRCDLPGLATLAQEQLDHCLAARTGGDLTRVVQRLFERQADLFPIRDQGGAYFVPVAHTAFLERVQTFLSSIQGQMHRFPVPAGTAQGDRSVKETVAAGLASLIAEHEAAIASFGEDTRADTLERAAQRIRLTKHQISAYAEYLAEQRSRLEVDLAEAARKLRERVEALTACHETDVVSS
jgi:hypothetical protein